MKTQNNNNNYLFGTMASRVFHNMLDNYSRKNGDWEHSASGDVMSFAPRHLFSMTQATGNTKYADMAMATCDWYYRNTALMLPSLLLFIVETALDSVRGKIRDVVESKNENLPSKLKNLRENLGVDEEEPGWDAQQAIERFSKGLGGLLNLLDGYVYSGEKRYIDLYCRILDITNEVAMDTDTFDKYVYVSATYMYGEIASLNCEYVAKLSGIDNADLPGTEIYTKGAEDILAKMKKLYWCPDLSLYYKVNNEKKCNKDLPFYWNLTIQNVPMVALSQAYYITGKDEYKTMFEAMYDEIDTLWWDKDEKGYISTTNYKLKGLTENMSIALALVMTARKSGLDENHDYVTRIKDIFTYIEDLLYRETGDDGPHLLHDNQENLAWCSGCNFFTLEAIYRLNLLLGNSMPENMDL